MCNCNTPSVSFADSSLGEGAKIVRFRKKGGSFMKKVYKLDEVDCAVCAQNMENGIKKIVGVHSAVVSYVTQKLLIECDEADLERISEEAQKVIKKVDPRCRIVRN